MMTFDYAASAELFIPKRKPGASQSLSYRRFTTAAEAKVCVVVRRDLAGFPWLPTRAARQRFQSYTGNR